MSDQSELKALRREKNSLLAAIVSDEIEALRCRVVEVEMENIAFRGRIEELERENIALGNTVNALRGALFTAQLSIVGSNAAIAEEMGIKHGLYAFEQA